MHLQTRTRGVYRICHTHMTLRHSANRITMLIKIFQEREHQLKTLVSRFIPQRNVSKENKICEKTYNFPILTVNIYETSEI